MRFLGLQVPVCLLIVLEIVTELTSHVALARQNSALDEFQNRNFQMSQHCFETFVAILGTAVWMGSIAKLGRSSDLSASMWGKLPFSTDLGLPDRTESARLFYSDTPENCRADPSVCYRRRTETRVSLPYGIAF